MYIKDAKEFWDNGKVGDWCIVENKETNRKSMYLVFPTPSKTPDAIVRLPLRLVTENDQNCGVCWEWNGNFESPTLSPSISVKSHLGDWHGFLREGILIDA